MIKFFVFVMLWQMSIKGGLLRGHWRWVTMLVYLLGLVLDEILFFEIQRYLDRH